jgi:hypothetical protein
MIRNDRQKNEQHKNGPEAHPGILIPIVRVSGQGINNVIGYLKIEIFNKDIDHKGQDPPVKLRDFKFKIDIECGRDLNNTHL